MTHHEKFILCQKLVEDCVEIQNKKGHDYAVGEDALASFKRIALQLDLNPYQVWYVYFMKHVDAIATFVCQNVYRVDMRTTPSEPIEERIKDAINYLMLLYCLLSEFGGIVKGTDEPNLNDRTSLLEVLREKVKSDPNIKAELIALLPELNIIDKDKERRDEEEEEERNRKKDKERERERHIKREEEREKAREEEIKREWERDKARGKAKDAASSFISLSSLGEIFDLSSRKKL